MASWIPCQDQGLIEIDQLFCIISKLFWIFAYCSSLIASCKIILHFCVLLLWLPNWLRSSHNAPLWYWLPNFIAWCCSDCQKQRGIQTLQSLQRKALTQIPPTAIWLFSCCHLIFSDSETLRNLTQLPKVTNKRAWSRNHCWGCGFLNATLISVLIFHFSTQTYVLFEIFLTIFLFFLQITNLMLPKVQDRWITPATTSTWRYWSLYVNNTTKDI